MTIPDHLQHFVPEPESFTPGELAAIEAHEKRILGIVDCFDQLDADSLDEHSTDPELPGPDDHARELARYLDQWSDSIQEARDDVPHMSLPFQRWHAAELSHWFVTRDRLLTAVAGWYLGRDEGHRYVRPVDVDYIAVTVDRPLTDEEIREHRLCHRASLYAWCVAALLGHIATVHGEEAATYAAAMVDDIGHNGGAPYCDDLDTPGASS